MLKTLTTELTEISFICSGCKWQLSKIKTNYPCDIFAWKIQPNHTSWTICTHDLVQLW